MIVGFLAEDFHTEVLDYLFELHNSSEFDLILYNTNDRYNNLEIYKLKYPNIKIKDVSYFILDLTSGLFDKAYMVSYDNVIVPEMLKLYKSKLIFIAHHQRHIQLFSFLNMDFITLTPGLFIDKKNINYTLPIIKGSDTNFILNQTDKKDNDINIALIGAFTRYNKNLETINHLINHNIKLHVFTCNKDVFLDEISTAYPSNFILYKAKTTNEILKTIKENNIQFIGLFPNHDSNFFKNQWSGSIAFAYNHNIPIILPEKIAELYNLKGHVSYQSNDDIIYNMEKFLGEYNKYESEFYKFKNDIYERNRLIISIVLNNYNDFQDNKNILCTMTDYGGIYLLKNDIIGRKILNNNYHNKELLGWLESYIMNNTISNYTILDIGSYIGSFSLGLLSLDKNINIISIEPQSYIAKLQKKTMILNNYINKIKIYNNAIGHKCLQNIQMSNKLTHMDSISQTEEAIVDYNDQNVRNYGGLQLGKDGESVDMITIDSLKLNALEILKIDAEGSEKLILYGAQNTIKKYKPIIIYEYNWKNNEIIDNLFDITDNIKNFNIVNYLLSLGYKTENVKRYEDIFIWTY